ncbi:MAG TPA: hypothetical protein V6D17_09540 [Candidatus Obscuribacterales bacterium]
MHTSLVRRTLDPIIAALAATLLFALAAQAQIVVTSQTYEPGKKFHLKANYSIRLSPEIIRDEVNIKKPHVDQALIDKVVQIRSTIPTSAPSYYLVPGSSAQ